MQKKKILIHSLVFSPDGVSTAYLYNDIALGFIKYGYDVVVLTSTPHYNLVKNELERQPLTKRWGGLFYKSNFRGIPVYHVPQKKFKNFPARVAGFIYWHILSFILGLLQRNLSLIISPSPPLTIGLVNIILAKIKRAKVIYNVQEIYPDFLINQGSLTSGFLLNILHGLERFVYNYSDKVTTIDDIFYETIIKRFRDPSKLVVIPNFVDTGIYKPVTDDNVLDKELFPDKPVLKVMYAGNIGHAQDWEPLLRVAGNLKSLPIEFWVIGEGVVKEAFRKDIEAGKLINIHLLPYQSRERMANIVGYADIHFIFMNPQMEGLGFPSKVYTIMACKKPLLVVSGENTPLYHFLKNKQCAFLIKEPDIDKKCAEIESVLRTLIDDKMSMDSFGQNGFDIIQKQYSKKAVIHQYVEVVKNVLK